MRSFIAVALLVLMTAAPHAAAANSDSASDSCNSIDPEICAAIDDPGATFWDTCHVVLGKDDCEALRNGEDVCKDTSLKWLCREVDRKIDEILQVVSGD